MNFDNDRPRRKLPVLGALLVVVVAGLVAAGIWLRPRFESQPQQISLSPDKDAFGKAPLEVSAADAGAGLKSLAVTLSAGGTDTAIAAEQFAQPVKEKKLSVDFSKVPGIKEGPATLRVVAR